MSRQNKRKIVAALLAIAEDTATPVKERLDAIRLWRELTSKRPPADQDEAANLLGLSKR